MLQSLNKNFFSWQNLLSPLRNLFKHEKRILVTGRLQQVLQQRGFTSFTEYFRRQGA
jgi:hypothetical protein